VFYAVVVTDQRGEQQESAFLFPIADPEDDPVPYLEMPAAMGTNKIIFHDAWDLGFCTSYEIQKAKSIDDRIEDGKGVGGRCLEEMSEIQLGDKRGYIEEMSEDTSRR
jgi:hypothetical protein